MAENQRQRILAAVADVASLTGYAAMTVDEICGTAGLSRRTFYDLFSDKHEAFMATLDRVAAGLEAAVNSGFAPEHEFPAAVRNCLAAFLGYLQSEPHRADVLLVESLAAGPEAIERRRASLVHFAELLRRGAEHLPAERRPPPLTAETIVGGIYEVAYSRTLSGEVATLMELLPDLAYSMMQPYLGHEVARIEAVKPPTL